MNKLKNKIVIFKNWFFRLSFLKKLAVILPIIFIIWIISHSFLGKTKAPQYQTAQVQKGTIITTVNESGNVVSNNSAEIDSPTTGIVEAIYVSDGESVTAGENLFKVKSIATPQEIASAYASYLAAQSALQSAQAKLNSLQSALFVANQKFLTDRGVLNPSDQQKADPVYIEENANWLQAEADYKNQSTVISQAQAALDSASLSYQATQDSIVTAPISGTVANIAEKVGSEVSAALTTASLSTNAVLSIGNFSAPYIKVQASEVDIPNIHAGQKATITLSAYPNKTFVGNVDQVDSVGTITSGVVTYNVFISLIAPPANILPGMSASVDIQTARKDDVLTVPSSAIQAFNGQSTVRVLKNGKITNVSVSTGLSSDTDTEITSGLSEGETVVTGIIAGGGSAAGGTTSPFSRKLGGFGGGRLVGK